MAEEVQVSDGMVTKDSNDSASLQETDEEIQTKIKDAMKSRISYFRQQSDSTTFEGVRRLLEKDLGLEEFSLDVHKRFIKARLVECLDGGDEDNTSKNSAETEETNLSSARGETAESAHGTESSKQVKDPGSEEDEKMEDSPVLGLLTKAKKSETKDNQTVDNKEVLSETTIKKALQKRASYIKQNLENVTMARLRRLLEEDLKLETYALDPYKKFISEQLDEVLTSEPPKAVKKNAKKSNIKASKRASSEESLEFKKRKRPEKVTKASAKKHMKNKEIQSEDIGDEKDVADSEDDDSQSSAEKTSKKKEKKEVTTPAYGKRVEHLKSVIKACGMSVPPSIYKKVKQATEERREARLIKELEEILSKEGLSSNPSEKEIKDVRKKKERAKELEGIDTSNIISSSRRRSTTSFTPPPKPQIPDISDDSEGSDENEDDDEDNDDNDEENDADGGDEGSDSDAPNEDGENSD